MSAGDDAQPMTPAELREMADQPPAPVARIAPAEDLRVMVTTLIELLAGQRDAPFFYAAGVRDRFDDFQAALLESGFDFRVTHDRQTRAAAQRRLGERAEAQGNVAGAIAFYDLALRSWPEVGCRRQLDRLRGLARDSEA